MVGGQERDEPTRVAAGSTGLRSCLAMLKLYSRIKKLRVFGFCAFIRWGMTEVGLNLEAFKLALSAETQINIRRGVRLNYFVDTSRDTFFFGFAAGLRTIISALDSSGSTELRTVLLRCHDRALTAWERLVGKGAAKKLRMPFKKIRESLADDLVDFERALIAETRRYTCRRKGYYDKFLYGFAAGLEAVYITLNNDIVPTSLRLALYGANQEVFSAWEDRDEPTNIRKYVYGHNTEEE